MKKLTVIAAALVLAGCGQETSSASDSAAPAGTADESAPGDAGAGGAETASLADEGRRYFNECAVCHTVKEGDANRIGPNLFNIVGREAGQADGFAYSTAMAQSGIVWTEENLDAFLENPQNFMRGNRMAYVGQRNAERREALIAYLKTLKPAAD